MNESENILTVGLCNLGFKQVISEATHERGNALDHLYFRDMKKGSQIQVELQSVYWSDHDAVTGHGISVTALNTTSYRR